MEETGSWWPVSFIIFRIRVHMVWPAHLMSSWPMWSLLAHWLSHWPTGYPVDLSGDFSHITYTVDPTDALITYLMFLLIWCLDILVVIFIGLLLIVTSESCLLISSLLVLLRLSLKVFFFSFHGQFSLRPLVRAQHHLGVGVSVTWQILCDSFFTPCLSSEILPSRVLGYTW